MHEFSFTLYQASSLLGCVCNGAKARVRARVAARVRPWRRGPRAARKGAHRRRPRGRAGAESGQQKGPPLAKGPLCVWRVASVSEKHSQDEVEGQSLE
jgi:hypothetical protein